MSNVNIGDVYRSPISNRDYYFEVVEDITNESDKFIQRKKKYGCRYYRIEMFGDTNVRFNNSNVFSSDYINCHIKLSSDEVFLLRMTK